MVLEKRSNGVKLLLSSYPVAPNLQTKIEKLRFQMNNVQHELGNILDSSAIFDKTVKSKGGEIGYESEEFEHIEQSRNK